MKKVMWFLFAGFVFSTVFSSCSKDEETKNDSAELRGTWIKQIEYPLDKISGVVDAVSFGKGEGSFFTDYDQTGGGTVFVTTFDFTYKVLDGVIYAAERFPEDGATAEYRDYYYRIDGDKLYLDEVGDPIGKWVDFDVYIRQSAGN
jgi:hypothetical protein